MRQLSGMKRNTIRLCDEGGMFCGAVSRHARQIRVKDSEVIESDR